jgi:hypothetical protein
MIYVIPTRTDVEHYTEVVELDGVNYDLLFRWNHRDGTWMLTIAPEQEAPILAGIRVVADTPLIEFCGHADKPHGTLMAVDTSGQGRAPGLQDLGGRVMLLYEVAE